MLQKKSTFFSKQSFLQADNHFMKTSNKSSIITGVVLLLLAALFSISLILQPLDFGVAGPGHNNFFYVLGNIIFTVYGFSSILIPIFLLIAGLSCFATTWTARKTVFLLTAIIPFFTSVITENICRSIISLGDRPLTALKVVITLVTGILLIVMEFLGEAILADKINEKFFSKSKNKKDNKNNVDDLLKDVKDDKNSDKTTESEKSPNFFTKLKEKISNKNEDDDSSDNEFENLKKFDTLNDDFAKSDENSTANVDKLSNFEEKTPKNLTPLNDISFVTDEDMQISEEELKRQEIELGLREPDEDSQKIETSTEDEKNTQNSQNYELENPQNEENENRESEENVSENPATIISQEEFAALTNFDDKNDENSQNDDELEWNNLPPKPEKLPPEYEDEIDLDDPALDFPPKEEVENDGIFSQNDENFTQNDENQNYETEESEYAEYDLTKPVFEAKNSEENSPYSTTHYIDSVVENPAFPHTISLTDDDFFDETDETAEKKTVEIKKSKFPAKISFEDDFQTQNDEENNELNEDSDTTPAFSAKNQTENSPQNDDFSPNSINLEIEEEPQIFNQIEKNEEEILRSLSADKPTSRLVVQNDEVLSQNEENFTQNNEDITQNVKENHQNEEFDETQENSKNVGFSFAASNVFSNMEKDIRESIPVSEIQPLTTENVKPQSANNLTADELTDFFDAQQEENTPKTTTIEPNPPKIGNRAMKKGPYVIPSDLLIAYKDDQYWIIDDATKQASLKLKQTLSEFNIEAQIIGIKKGPVVTMFEILPAPGVKLSKIVALQDNIALSLAAQSVRIVAPIPGKQAVGIEVPNKHRSVVGFREIIEMDLPEWEKMSIPVVLGKDILGKSQLIDLAKTPHMLIAGATGSGKSVCVNSLILSILYKRSPFDVKLVLVDPKVVELKLYNNIPHLLTPVITEPKKALQSLQWCLCEMERRYALLDSMGVRDIANYNLKIKNQNIATEKLPYIVVIIDEFADLMATSGKELENVIARLTAMSRAVGIHLVLATQRPSVNVITGLIKANIPTRIAFMVASRTDSNIIIDTVGAEKLLGRGDMLYASASDPAPIRIQGTFVTDQEVENVVKSVKDYGEPDYIDDEMFSDDDDERGTDLFGQPMDDDDPLYDQALEIVVQAGKASASYLQRRLSIGYNRAARLVEEMEERGIVGPANGSKPREIIHIP